MKEKNKNIKYVFHIVNSVKGGCGKSTFSLLLGEYWRKKGFPTYIIDLDICGTSWELEYRVGIKEDSYLISNDSIYINDVIENYRNANNRNVWHRINFEEVFYKSDRASSFMVCDTDSKDDLIKSHQKVTIEYMPEHSDNPLNICIADPNRNNSLDSYELDLFENAVKHLIETNIIDIHSNNDKQVHIILDMPPSNEKHAERVLNNWLLSQKFAHSHNNYIVQLYLMSTMDRAHMYSNLDYLIKLLNKHSITDCTDMLIKNDRLRVKFVLNDILSAIDTVSFRDSGIKVSQTWLSHINEKLKHVLPLFQCVYLHKLVMPHKVVRFNEDFSSILYKKEAGSLWSSIMSANAQTIDEKAPGEKIVGEKMLSEKTPYVDTIFGLIATEDAI